VPREVVTTLYPSTVVVYSAGDDQAITGEFQAGRILATSFEQLMKSTGTEKDDNAVLWLRRYYGTNKICSAIEIKSAKLYKKPITLSDIKLRIPSFRPPQNFIYLRNQPQLVDMLNFDPKLL
jgi:predicted transcriptional regulator